MSRNLLVLGTTAFFTAVAGAQVVEFNYFNLAGAYNSTTQNLIIQADTDSSGSVVDQTTPTTVTATFGSGFAIGSPANYFINMAISSISTNSAAGGGTFTITDAEGDQLVGYIVGTWRALAGGGMSFNGIISDGEFQSVSGDGSFDGTDGGSFTLPNGEFTGAGQYLAIDVMTSTFFGESFTATVSASGQLVPAPGSIALGMVGLGAMARRRRR